MSAPGLVPKRPRKSRQDVSAGALQRAREPGQITVKTQDGPIDTRILNPESVGTGRFCLRRPPQPSTVWARVEEIAAMCIRAVREYSYITGKNLTVDGGNARHSAQVSLIDERGNPG